MSEQTPESGAAEDAAGVDGDGEEHHEPASPSSTPGGEPARTDGYAEEAAGVDED